MIGMARAGRVWIFDLDNTLHDASPHIFPHINRAMTDYIRRHLDLDEDGAARLRVDYWHRYGATLLGLMRHHGTDPHHFLRETHDFPDLGQMLVFERGLKAMLRRLPGKKIVFSNAPRHYTEAVLGLTGIARLFDGVYSIEGVRFRPKPDVCGFLHLVRTEKLDPRRCVMVEDSLPNLCTAKRLGMKTVWVNAGTRGSPCADVKIASILALPQHLARL